MWTNFRHRKAPVIRTLLENCLFLLDREKHSQVRVIIIEQYLKIFLRSSNDYVSVFVIFMFEILMIVNK